MTPEFSVKKENQTFSDTLNAVMSDKNYLVGAEPEGSGWNFSDWPGYNFKERQGWVLREKFFAIPTIDRKILSMRIIETDPEQFDIETNSGKIKISHTITPVTAKGFPIIFVGKDINGEEKIVRNKQEPVSWHEVPEEFKYLSGITKKFIKNSTTVDKEGSEWANFLKDILSTKRILPAHFQPTEQIVWDNLELSPGKKYSQKEEELAEMLILEQELLGLALADYTVTV